MKTILCCVFIALSARAVHSQQPTLSISKSAPAPGALVRLRLHAAGSDAPVGEMAGEKLHFHRAGDGIWTAIGAVPVDATGEVSAFAVVAGSADTIRASVTIPRPRPSTARGRPRALSVSPRFTQPLDEETEARIARENKTAREIGLRSHDTPKLWSAPFIRPRSSIVTSRFGSGRMFNGTLTSRHLGVDFRGRTGEPVRAANRGVVALVDELFLAGNVVYIDHGEGLVTAYFHLSKTLVAAGDTVQRGQAIGLVGATGRVTGPHLHWSARYGQLTVNPLDLISVVSR